MTYPYTELSMGWTLRTCMKLTLAKEFAKKVTDMAGYSFLRRLDQLWLHWYISPLKIVKEESEIYRDVENECFTNDWALHLIKLEASVLKKILWLSRVFSCTPPILHCLTHFHSPPKEHSLPGGKSEEVSCKQTGPTWSFILAGEASSMMAKSLSNAAAFVYEGCMMTEEILMSCSWPSVWSKWCSPSRTYQ